METHQTSTHSAIEAIRSSKKGAEKLTIHEFIKRELQSITNEEITNTLKTLWELRLTENKPSNDNNSCVLIDNFSIADSQLHIPTTMATPITERSAFKDC